MKISSNIVAAAQAAQTKYRVPASVSIAQWAIESGWGAHAPGNNPFGMKPRANHNDPQQTLLTTEYIHGQYLKVQQHFRSFPDIASAFEAHAELLASAPVYGRAMAALPDLNHFIDSMAAHYATDPLYASKIKATIQQHNLTAFDHAEVRP